jgi:sensor domain CHASE-containing protein
MHEAVGSAKKGLLALREGPAIVASQPIVKSSGEGPAKGTIIFVSFLDKDWQKETSDLSSASRFPSNRSGASGSRRNLPM